MTFLQTSPCTWRAAIRTNPWLETDLELDPVTKRKCRTIIPAESETENSLSDSSSNDGSSESTESKDSGPVSSPATRSPKLANRKKCRSPPASLSLRQENAFLLRKKRKLPASQIVNQDLQEEVRAYCADELFSIFRSDRLCDTTPMESRPTRQPLVSLARVPVELTESLHGSCYPAQEQPPCSAVLKEIIRHRHPHGDAKGHPRRPLDMDQCTKVNGGVLIKTTNEAASDESGEFITSAPFDLWDEELTDEEDDSCDDFFISSVPIEALIDGEIVEQVRGRNPNLYRHQRWWDPLAKKFKRLYKYEPQHGQCDGQPTDLQEQDDKNSQGDRQDTWYGPAAQQVVPLKDYSAAGMKRQMFVRSDAIRRKYLGKSAALSASSEDTSFLHDARGNLLRRESEQDKQRGHLTYVINAEHGHRLDNVAQIGLSADGDEEGPEIGGKLQPNSRHQLTSLHRNFLRVAEQWKLERQVPPPVNPDDIVIMRTNVQDDQMLLDAVFHEAACQAETECKERGLLLKSIREKYTRLMNRLPRLLDDIREDLITQRAIDKNFAEQLVSCQAWWRQQRLVMENVGEQNQDTLHDLSDDIRSIARQIPVYEDEARQLRSLASLHFSSRARAEKNLQELMLSREQWQGTAYLICIKLIKDQKLIKLTEMHGIHQTWYNSAKRSYRSLRILDATVVADLRALEKEFIMTYQILEGRLLEDEVETVHILQSVRAAVDRKLFLGLFKEDKLDLLFVAQCRKSLVKWHNSLKKIANRFTGNQVKENSEALDKLQKSFEMVIKAALTIYVARFNRELEIASSHPASPIKKLSKKLLLFTDVGPNFQRVSPIDADFGGPIFDSTESPLLSPKPDTPFAAPLDTLTDAEFDNSKSIFREMLTLPADLTIFRHSMPYTEMYRIWKSFQVVQRAYQNRIRGDGKFRNWINRLCSGLVTSVEHAKDENYFIRSDDEYSFTDDAAGLLDEVHGMLTFIRNDFAEIAPPVRNQNIVRQFLMQVNAWFMFSQSAIEATTESVLERISILYSAMARCGIELVAFVCPGTAAAVTEKRLKDLLDKKSQSDEGLHLIRETINGVLEDLYKMSLLLDKIPKPAELADPDGGPPPKWHSISELEGTLAAQVDKWRYYATMGVNYACEIRNNGEKQFLPDSKLANYDMSSTHEQTKFDQYGADFPDELLPIARIPKCLQADTIKAWDRSDMIEVRCLGEDENTYVKPFRIATMENLSRETAPEIMKDFLSVQSQLSMEKIITVKSNQLLLELEHEFADVNSRNQLLNVEIQHRQALKDGSQPPIVTLPEVQLPELEEQLRQYDPLPPLFNPNSSNCDYFDIAAVKDWGHLRSHDIADLELEPNVSSARPSFLQTLQFGPY